MKLIYTEGSGRDKQNGDTPVVLERWKHCFVIIFFLQQQSHNTLLSDIQKDQFTK